MEILLVLLLFTPKKATLGEVEQKAVETAAGFLARQMESINEMRKRLAK